MCDCTCIRNCEISFCPSVDNSCVSEYDETPCTNVAPATDATILGSTPISCPIITLLINGPDDTGSTKLHNRFTTISRKLTPISPRRGRISAHTSGSTFFKGGLGRFAVRSAEIALPVPRPGLSAACIPLPAPNPGAISSSLRCCTRRTCVALTPRRYKRPHAQSHIDAESHRRHQQFEREKTRRRITLRVV